MIRSAATRILRLRHHHRHRPISLLSSFIVSNRFSSSPANESLNFHNPSAKESASKASDLGRGTLAETTSSGEELKAAAAGEKEKEAPGEGERRRRRVMSEYKEEQARVLDAALRHVNTLGWSEAAMMAGAREVGVSPSIVGAFPRKEAELVEYFMDDCLQRLIDIIDSDVELQNLIPSERISKLVRLRLEMQAPYVSRWAQVLSIQALPTNVPTSFNQRAMLVDEIWHAAGDVTTDIDWYLKRAVLGGIYSATEVFMLTDRSPDFRDTWAFLNARVRDAFDLKKTVQETQNLAEAVGAGMGSSIQGLARRVSQMLAR
ncbi:Ubiquinone biosynthesis protein COQ9, mitochondrial-like protein [Drosera capensis]